MLKKYGRCGECQKNDIRNLERDFFGGTVDKNPLVNARDIGSIPGPGRFHLPKNN